MVNRMRIGAHVSVAGGIVNCLTKAREMGADCIQIFASPPQSWQMSGIDKVQAEEFKKIAKKYDIRPVFIHASYLINLATANPSHLERSINALSDDLKVADLIGAEGVIVHVGSHKGRGFETVIDQIANSINQIFLQAKPTASLILENSAGTGDKIGAKFEELGEIIKAVGLKKLKICLDTQHTFACGYPIHQKDGLEKTLLELDQEVGINNLVVVHANDSKVPFMTANDRHENIGEGYIGKEGFRIILANPIMQKLPFILETPGFDNLGPDKRNIEILKELVSH